MTAGVLPIGLPDLPDADGSEFENVYLGAPKALTVLEELEATDAEQSKVTDDSKQDTMPQAIDLCVPPGKSSVVLTGPNTGHLFAHEIPSSPLTYSLKLLLVCPKLASGFAEVLHCGIPPL